MASASPRRSNPAANPHHHYHAQQQPSLGDLLDSRSIHSPLAGWVSDSNRDVHDRLFAAHYTLPGTANDAGPRSNERQLDRATTTQRSSSSMALHASSLASRTQPTSYYGTSIYHRGPGSSAASGYMPSLSYESTGASLQESSVGTDLASLVPGMTLLEEGDDGVLQMTSMTANHLRRPVYECTFSFLNCRFMSYSEAEWQTHCLSHWYGHAPPRRIMCPLCDALDGRALADGHAAWDARMAHIAVHHRQGENLATARPDFHLFQYLWQKRIIDDAELKELKGCHRLAAESRPYQTTQGMRMDRQHRTHPRPPAAY